MELCTITIYLDIYKYVYYMCIILFTARLYDHSVFEANPVPSNALPAYDSLHDPHLEEYFTKKFARINAMHKYTELNVSSFPFYT